MFNKIVKTRKMKIVSIITCTALVLSLGAGVAFAASSDINPLKTIGWTKAVPEGAVKVKNEAGYGSNAPGADAKAQDANSKAKADVNPVKVKDGTETSPQGAMKVKDEAGYGSQSTDPNAKEAKPIKK